MKQQTESDKQRPITTAKMTEIIVQEHCFHGLAMARFTPLNWFECDVYTVSRANLATEYEIKTTLADFKADAKKCRRVRSLGGEFTKHELLSNRSQVGPSRFYFCCQRGLLPMELLPMWAGLIEFFTLGGHVYKHIARRAPKLHGEPISETIRGQLLLSAYYRLHRNGDIDEQFTNGEGI